MQGGPSKTLKVPVAAKPKIRIQFAEKGTSARSSARGSTRASARGSVPQKATSTEDGRSEERSLEHAAVRGLRKKREVDEESYDSSFSRQLGAASSLGSFQKPNVDKKLGPTPPLNSLFGSKLQNRLK